LIRVTGKFRRSRPNWIWA